MPSFTVVGISVVLACGVITSLAACTTTSTPSASHAADTPVAGDIPDNQSFVTVQGKSGTFTLSVPEGWSESTSGTVTTYTDKLNSVSVEESAASAAPTVDSAKASAVPALLAARSNASGAKVSTFAAKGGSGIHIAFTADSAVDPVTGTRRPDAIEVYQFWMSGKQVAVTLEGPTTADNVDPWRIVTDSFSWTGK